MYDISQNFLRFYDDFVIDYEASIMIQFNQLNRLNQSINLIETTLIPSSKLQGGPVTKMPLMQGVPSALGLRREVDLNYLECSTVRLILPGPAVGKLA